MKPAGNAVSDLRFSQQTRLSFFIFTHKQKEVQRVVRVPSGRWQSCPSLGSWHPSAAVGTTATFSPSLSSPPTSPPPQLAGTGTRTETETSFGGTATVETQVRSHKKTKKRG